MYKKLFWGGGGGGGTKLIYKPILVRLTVFYASFTPSPQWKQLPYPPPFSLSCTHLEDMDIANFHTISCKMMKKLNNK